MLPIFRFFQIEMSAANRKRTREESADNEAAERDEISGSSSSDESSSNTAEQPAEEPTPANVPKRGRKQTNGAVEKLKSSGTASNSSKR